MGNQQCCDVQNQDYKPAFPQQEESVKITKIEPATLTGQPKVSRSSQSKNPNSESKSSVKFEVIIEDQIVVPKLSGEVQNRMTYYKQINSKTEEDSIMKKFGKEVYVGHLDNDQKLPQGYGKIYKIDGSIYVGEWKHGKASGKGVYIMKDGSFYEGQFSQNNAQGNGRFESNTFVYEGEFHQNKFQGKGIEKGPGYTFQGQFIESRKKQGTMTWKQNGFQFSYTGQFNSKNQFQGQGTLQDTNGRYKGFFQGGNKHGYGIYKFDNGLRYEGQYKDGKKNGKGTIYNCNDSIAYEGDFVNDLPHGEGNVYDGKGNKLKKKWVAGIDAEGL